MLKFTTTLSTSYRLKVRHELIKELTRKLKRTDQHHLASVQWYVGKIEELSGQQEGPSVRATRAVPAVSNSVQYPRGKE